MSVRPWRWCLDGTRDPLPTDVAGLPDLPDAFHDALDRAIPPMAMTLEPAARTAIEAHVRLLIAWNSRLNLTAIRDPVAIAIDHVADSLSAIPLLRESSVRQVLDLGSGGGFPGLPIAAVLPAGRALLVDSIAKKARFLAAAVKAAGLAGTTGVATARAEDLARGEQRERWPAVVARAVGSVADVAEIGLSLTAVGGILVIWKRRPIEAELAEAADLVEALGGGPSRLLASNVPERPDNVLVVVAKVRRTPPDYPRDPALRRRRDARNDRGLR